MPSPPTFVYLEIFYSKLETLLKNQLLCEGFLALAEAPLPPPIQADTTSLSSVIHPHLGALLQLQVGQCIVTVTCPPPLISPGQDHHLSHLYRPGTWHTAGTQ